mgnify:CR=1 FL=1
MVNNKSTDNTVSIVRRYQAENPHLDIQLIEQNEHQGIAPTRNHGFDYARSDIIGRTDADSVIAKEWVETVRRRFEDPAIDAASGPMGFHDMPLRGFLFRLDRILRGRVHKYAKNERFLLGANMAIRAQAWKSVRQLTQLDLEDRLHEDVDLALTLFKNDFEIAYELGMVVAMSARRVESSSRDFYRYVTRYTRTMKLHGIKSLAACTRRSSPFCCCITPSARFGSSTTWKPCNSRRRSCATSSAGRPAPADATAGMSCRSVTC